MRVPGTPGPMAQGAPQEQIPDAYLMMAAAQMQKMAQSVDPVDKAFRDKMTGTKDAPNQADIDKLDLNYAKAKEAEGAVPWRDKLIDPRKLSVKDLKASGIKY